MQIVQPILLITEVNNGIVFIRLTNDISFIYYNLAVSLYPELALRNLFMMFIFFILSNHCFFSFRTGWLCSAAQLLSPASGSGSTDLHSLPPFFILLPKKSIQTCNYMQDLDYLEHTCFYSLHKFISGWKWI